MSKKIKKLKYVNKYGVSRSIPAEVKQIVRRRCGFGCVICGLAIYHYEHFDPVFENLKVKHEPNGITLLCPNHHQNKTSGRLSVETVKKFNAKPKALELGKVNDLFDLDVKSPTVKIGNFTFKDTPVLIQFEYEPIIKLELSEEEEQPHLLSATLRDTNGDIVLEIDKNEWKSSTMNWDCKVEGPRIVIRSAPKKVELIIRTEPPSNLVFEKISMLYKGIFMVCSENMAFNFSLPNGMTFSVESGEIEGGEVGLHLSSLGVAVGGVMLEYLTDEMKPMKIKPGKSKLNKLSFTNTTDSDKV
ncbi:hypothetical protein [Pontibacter russatus]|uniref:hypothetical protein n=1 Tax=Pontibacter russatus TaxID=2694929 RepID=UPI00137AAD1C|nr:hypothetical protein [Pontibacter russatus]